MYKLLKNILQFTFLYGGFALIIAAAWIVYQPLGFLVTGCLSVLIAISIYRSDK